ncbi:hypothetical protein FisN_15Hh260 [Fistulifera solaris]|uniref:Uncharacterized protein n=1 Tax=Fistulifera solaris TaxID=1519565 RepID=A0A1Z5JG97_FISSO|nr:hypothetical protein FisN_15Hh260 [Fistulifera solaris]|eukprot:GAX12781.1 hypothetical protein FisN_15Hh260 [Fistulifera solaris]
MFSLASGVYQTYMAPQQVNVLLVGASSVGKTTLLERIKVTQFQKQGVVVLDDDDSPFLQELYQAEAEEEEELQESSSSLASPLPTSLPGRIVSRRRVVEPRSDESTTTTTTTPTPRPKKGLWVCPSPPKYQNTVTDDEEDEVLLPDQQSLETIDIRNSATTTTKTTTVSPPSSLSPPQQQYDLKPNLRMLPFSKIRPTIGMNLGQFKNIYGAKCHVWDVGGRLHDLWERYYEDCDAVLFVYKWEEEDVETNNNQNKNEDDDDRPRPPTRQEQKVLLQTVRQNIPEDVPFLIFLHSWQSPAYERYTNSIYRSTEPLLPTLPNQALCVGNAGTGQGVRAAMEWLLPLAKQQQRVRDKLSAE